MEQEILCACGEHHPLGYICQKALHMAVSSSFRITEMDCPTEEALIRKKLASFSDISNLEFNLIERTLKIKHAPAALPAITEALESLDLGAVLIDIGTAPEVVDPLAGQIPWKRLGLAALLAAAAEVCEFSGVLPRFWPALLALGAIALSGLTTYKKGWTALRNLTLNINALMSLAVTGAVLIGSFPEAAMVMVLFNISEAIEALSLDRARRAIKSLLALSPEKAEIRQVDGTWLEVEAALAAVGDRVRVKPGAKIALDGVIVLGASSINQAPITGESMPVEKTVGDTVYAGTINESASFEYEVTALASDSALVRIVHAVEQAQASRAPVQHLVDVFAKYYTPAICVLSVLTIIAALILNNFTQVYQAVYLGLVILVIGCPCALVVSTPVTLVGGMACAARHGILIKGGKFLEQGRQLQWLALDKTGTLTLGRPVQTNYLNVAQKLSDEKIRALAATLAARSDHPVSKALARDYAENIGPVGECSHFTALAGEGVSATIDQQTWYLGNHRLIERLGRCSEALEEKLFTLEKQGKSVVGLIGDNGVEALFAVSDTLKPSSMEAIKELKALGVKTLMLTGDNEPTAKAIAEAVGTDSFKANLLPEEKLQAIAELEAQGLVVGMVGDGINDSPALAQASIGFAMAKNGTGTAVETADVALMDDDLRKIPRFIRQSRTVYAILVENICLALSVKALFLILAFLGHATMWMAVFADVGTSLLVVFNGLRTLRK